MPIEEKIGNFWEFYSLIQKMKRISIQLASKFNSLTNIVSDCNVYGWIAFVDN